MAASLSLEGFREAYFQDDFFSTHLLALGLGLLASVQGCIYPLIPIIVSIFGATGKISPLRKFSLVFVYVQGVATLYAIMGIAAALSGSRFGNHQANPWFNLIVVLLMIYLGFVFGGFAEIPVPRFIQNLYQKSNRAGMGGAYFMGLFSGVIAASCSAPVFIFILQQISLASEAGTATGLALGFSLSYFFALGMGLLFFAVAVFGLNLPRSGGWQEKIRKLGSLVLFTAALFYFSNLVPLIKSENLLKMARFSGDAFSLPFGYELSPGYFMLAFFGFLLLTLAWLAHRGKAEHGEENTPRPAVIRVRLVAFYLAGTIGLYFIANAFDSIQAKERAKVTWVSEQLESLYEAEPVAAALKKEKLKELPRATILDFLLFNNQTREKTGQALTEKEIHAFLKEKGITGAGDRFVSALSELKAKPIMIDFWADWCKACKDLEHGFFPRPEVAAALERFHLVRIDLTHDSPETEALEKRFSILGLPYIIFYDSHGLRVPKIKFMTGSISPTKFIQQIDSIH